MGVARVTMAREDLGVVMEVRDGVMEERAAVGMAMLGRTKARGRVPIPSVGGICQE